MFFKSNFGEASTWYCSPSTVALGMEVLSKFQILEDVEDTGARRVRLSLQDRLGVETCAVLNKKQTFRIKC